jgi:NADPH:quinone reductase-like Zn-dependent oxidoreductase
VVTWSRPHVIGYDVSGVVVACGQDASKFQVGDQVFGMLPHDNNGSLAEYVYSRWGGGLLDMQH